MSERAPISGERDGDVTILTIDRPERRNAVTASMCRELHRLLTQAEGDGSRAVVLRGADGHFCAGADLAGVEAEDFRSSLRSLLDAMVASRLPLVAAIEGVALGAGTQLAVACDLRVATPDARFGIPAAKIGLMVDHWTVRRLALVAGAGPARAMLLAAEEVSGSGAERLGLVQRLGSPSDAVEWARGIAGLAPLSIAGHKLALNRLESPLDDPEVAAAIDRAWSSADVQEGQAAFRERRPPRFEGK
jgi:enoyl-CoA hydratase